MIRDIIKVTTKHEQDILTAQAKAHFDAVQAVTIAEVNLRYALNRKKMAEDALCGMISLLTGEDDPGACYDATTGEIYREVVVEHREVKDGK